MKTKKIKKLDRAFLMVAVLILMVSSVAPFGILNNTSVVDVNDVTDTPDSNFSGDMYYCNATGVPPTIDGFVDLSNNEYDTGNTGDAVLVAYFQYDLHYLYFGLIVTTDHNINVFDYVELYLDVDHSNSLTTDVDIMLKVYGDDTIELYTYSGTDFEKATNPAGLAGAASIQTILSVNVMEYEMRIPLSVVDNNINETIGFQIATFDYDTPFNYGYPTSPPFNILDVTLWEELNFLYSNPTLTNLVMDQYGGFNDSVRLNFEVEYTSPSNLKVDNVRLLMTDYVSAPFSTYLYEEDYDDDDCTDGKIYSGSYSPSSMLENNYSYYAIVYDTVQSTYSDVRDNLIMIGSKPSNFSIFDGLTYEYDFFSYLSFADTFTDTYTDLGNGEFQIACDQTYSTPATSIRNMTLPERNFTVDSGSYPFNDNTHEWAFVPRNLTLHEQVYISIIDEGDVSFNVSSLNSIQTYEGVQYLCYYLTSDVDDGYAYYEKQTGLLLSATFQRSGSLIFPNLDDFTVSLSTTNMFENIYAPIVRDLIITPQETDIKTLVHFNLTYSDIQGNVPETVNVTLHDPVGNYDIDYELSLDSSLGTDYTQGVRYSLITYLENTTFPDTWKNYTSYFTINDGLFEARNPEFGAHLAPNVSYVNDNPPVLSDHTVFPVSPVGNGTIVLFKVNYTDLDNNAPPFVLMTLNDTVFQMFKNDSSDKIYLDGCWFEISIKLNDTGIYLFNFTTLDEGLLIEYPGGGPDYYVFEVYDKPPEIYIQNPNEGFKIGDTIPFEMSSPDADVEELWYEVYNHTDDSWVTGMRNITYSEAINITLTPGDFEIFAWVNDTFGNYNSTSVNVTLSVNQTFSILLIDMDNSTLDTVYTSVMEEMGFDYNITKSIPDLPTIINYDVVLLVMGNNQYNFTDNETIFESFLDGGGSLYISGQDYLNPTTWGPTQFQQEYLGIESYVANSINMNMVGVSENWISDGTSFVLSDIADNYDNYTHGPIFNDATDQLNVYGTEAQIAFQNGNSQTTGIMHDNGTYRTLFTSFEFARIPQAQQKEMLETILFWLGNSSSVTVDSPIEKNYPSLDIDIFISSEDPSLDSVWFNIYNETGANFVYTQDQPYTINTLVPVTLSQGDFVLYVWANNSWKFDATAVVKRFRCDTSIPFVYINSPLNSTYTDRYGAIPPLNLTADSDYDAIWFNIFNYTEGINSYLWLTNQSYPFGSNLDLGDGYYRIEAWANDTTGNFNHTGMNYNFTTNKCPIPSIDSISNGQVIPSHVIPIVISATDEDLDMIVYGIYNLSNSEWVVPIDVYTGPTVSPYLVDGNYYLIASANDSSGLWTMYYANYTFSIDTTAPDITITLPTAINYTTTTIQILFRSTDSDANGGSYKYRIWDMNVGAWAQIADLPGNFASNTSYIYSIFPIETVDILDGNYRIHMWASDNVGNENEITRLFTVDTLNPVFTSINIGARNNDDPISITAEVLDAGTGVKSGTVTYSVGSDNKNYTVVMTDVNGDFVGVLPGWVYNTTIYYFVTILDGLDNSNTSSVSSFIVNSLAASEQTLDYTEELSVKIFIDVKTPGQIVISYSPSNPTAMAISSPDPLAILTYLEIEFTGTFHTAEIRFYKSFGIDLDQIRVMHFVGGQWVEEEMTMSNDGTYVYADIETFSTFAVIQVSSGGLLGELSPLVMAIIGLLALGFVVTFVMLSSTKKKLSIELSSKGLGGSGKKGKKGKGSDTNYSSSFSTSSPNETFAINDKTTDYPEQNLYTDIASKKKKKGKKNTVTPSFATGKIAPAPKETLKLDYYCDVCNETYNMPYSSEWTDRKCPRCSGELGIKVHCSNCDALFQIPAHQYEILKNDHTPCPTCNKPII